MPARPKKDEAPPPKQCPCDPETLIDLGEGYHPEGQIFYCPKCNIVGKVRFEDIESLAPLKFTKPLTETPVVGAKAKR